MHKIFRKSLTQDTIIAVFMGSSPPPAPPEGVCCQDPGGRFIGPYIPQPCDCLSPHLLRAPPDAPPDPTQEEPAAPQVLEWLARDMAPLKRPKLGLVQDWLTLSPAGTAKLFGRRGFDWASPSEAPRANEFARATHPEPGTAIVRWTELNHARN